MKVPLWGRMKGARAGPPGAPPVEVLRGTGSLATLGLLALAIALAAGGPARAGMVVAGGVMDPAGDNLSARATFTISGDVLTLLLENTTQPTSAPVALTGIDFFVGAKHDVITLGTPITPGTQETLTLSGFQGVQVDRQ